MNTQNLSTLQVFQLLARKCKNHFLQSCPKEFIRFICECIVNQLKGNLQAIKRHQVVKFQDEIWLLSLKRTSWKQRRNVLLSEKGLKLLAIITPPIINHLCWYGAVCSCPASVYNKSVTTQSFTKQELQKYEAEQPPTYQIDSLNLNKKLFGKADALIDKILSCSRIKLSNSQTIVLDGVDTGVLISDFTLHLRRKNADVPDIYFTLFDAAGKSPSLVFNQNAKAKERESWIPFKVWTTEAAKTVYARCCCLQFCTQLGKS